MEFVVLANMKFRDFTTDNLHRLLDDPPHSNWFGVLMARMKNKGLIRRKGYQPSARPEANGRPVAIWEVV